MKSNGWPIIGEYVVCNVLNVTDFGAYVKLEEYKNKEGFIHISEIKAGWVKYVRDYIREGQKIVCKVLNVDANRGHIDLSLKDVNDHQKRMKIQLWKNEQKAEKWLQIALGEFNYDSNKIEALYYELVNIFGTAYSGFEEAAIKGELAFKNQKIDKKIVDQIICVAHENIKDPFVEISGYVDLKTNDYEGINYIKKSLLSAYEYSLEEGIKIEIAYIGAPRYRIKVIAPDYKKAEITLKKLATQIISNIEKYNGTGNFTRHIESLKS